jgi:hypothetical protein
MKQMLKPPKVHYFIFGLEFGTIRLTYYEYFHEKPKHV